MEGAEDDEAAVWVGGRGLAREVGGRGYPLVPYKIMSTEARYFMENGLWLNSTRQECLPCLQPCSPTSAYASQRLAQDNRRPYRVFAERSDRLATVQLITCACSRLVGADYSLVDLRLRACPTRWFRRGLHRTLYGFMPVRFYGFSKVSQMDPSKIGPFGVFTWNEYITPFSVSLPDCSPLTSCQMLAGL